MLTINIKGNTKRYRRKDISNIVFEKEKVGRREGGEGEKGREKENKKATRRIKSYNSNLHK